MRPGSDECNREDAFSFGGILVIHRETKSQPDLVGVHGRWAA